ncbi:Predicted protein [Taphrina deformans PYCC 5710]|uniref:Metallo-beta-lactamase domain-containing protein n=1 Tax=Taphrina deformans (strain PYCC 5710 / ATCC 11124 / CBS 356.35 / IMI 108563 / JCM 9778 / NBRC 8474) TaxID=1097556 RepID=R4XFL3_TAPDE|nr:Predicted protein [Taphrina deformans PYCC 5710]|eukprot:CCG82132.1 Predicted protein [Taphrina deformans PYCC 5710]
MSTFDGCLQEFPNLAIDYFRPRSKSAPPVLAYLLSHVHSDHLQGLENKDFSGALIYCSQATKNLLLRIQERNVRVKYARSEVDRKVLKYAHLVQRRGKQRDILRTIPLHRPTKLTVGRDQLTVTLFDANHCPGATMFLIESSTSRVLYTGDIRAEPTFLATFLSNPLMIPYTSGQYMLDCIYLDTSARVGGQEYPPKFEGCRQLVRAIAQYPASTNFYFNAWCMGYEDIWMTISRAFRTKIHVDQYRKTLFESIANESYEYGQLLAQEPDCILTTDSSTTRFYSCESIDPCAHRPPEREEVYIKTVNAITLCDPAGGDSMSRIAEGDFGEELSLKTFSIGEDESLLGQESQTGSHESMVVDGKELPMVLVIPFARHSSWPELVRFVTSLRPRRVHSCTGDVGGQFSEFCHVNHKRTGQEEGEGDSTRQIQQYEALTKAGLWHESPRSKRQRLMNDVHI